ncbi:MAG: molybdenum cofactor guanylyltransferase [Chloroflexi bacterium]|nr:molybdenum cofactor guanylyltransferase [Chloroflexota bacterium]
MTGPPPLDDVVGIVLAGGRSTRFGTDKLAIEVDGRPLLHHAIEAVAAVAIRVIVVASPGTDPALPAELEARVHVVHDPESFGGPLVGLAAALAEADAPIALVVGGDMPRMVPLVLRRLVATVGPGRPAVSLEIPGRFHPLPMALDVLAARPAAATVLERGGRALRDLLRELGAISIPAPVWLALDPAAATIVDIDRPEDLGSAEPT